uniref:Calcineurin-like phosphoesterase domain-containing protein n=1 Tax=Panagrolaimus sp. PS1159 TaxID=55785 RepID=A0AC35FPV6_9BILA
MLERIILLFYLCINLTKGISPVEPEFQATKLFENNENELILIFTGDPQYYFPCTLTNKECKEKAEECRKKNGLNILSNRINKTGLSFSQIEAFELECIQIESKVSNSAQRRSIFDLNRRLINKPKALIINGDLTNYGHARELTKFKEEWMSLPLYILAGLGNHDYENNVNDCIANQCANNMLYWFVRKYAPQAKLHLDYKSSTDFFKTTYKGSFAYARTLCIENGQTCVRVIQLNNRPDYATSVQSASQWEVQSSLQWLKRELEATHGNRSWPILINLHNLDKNAEIRIRNILSLWFRRPENQNIIRKVAIFFAHMHERHELKTVCIAGTTVPFVYVGSVPHNRFTTVKFTDSSAYFFFMKSNINTPNTSIIARNDFKWKPC